jgi:hypothetical protein
MGIFMFTSVATFFVFLVSSASFGFSIYLLADFLNYDTPVSTRGSIGDQGGRGFNGTCDETPLYELLGLFQDLNTTTAAFNFCPTTTCTDLDFLVNDLETILDESNLRGYNLVPLSNSIDDAVSITTNGTFCSSNICSYNQLILEQLLETFGSENTTGVLTTVAAQLAELYEIVTNDTFAKFPITDNSIVNGTISLYKINGFVPNSVIVTNDQSVLTTETQLSTELGGTGKNFSGANGFLQVIAGVFYANTSIAYDMLDITGKITNSDISNTANINGSKILPGTANSVVITNSLGTLTTETALATSRGGFGMNMSSATGYTLWTSGVPTTQSNIDRIWVASTTPNAVVINNPSGLLTEETLLSVTRGGTGKNLASSSGYLIITNGVVNTTVTVLTLSQLNITGQLTDTDFSTSANISRLKIALGTPNYVLINDGSGYISEEQFLSTSRGGTGINSTGFTGFVFIVNGAYTPLSTIPGAFINFAGSVSNSDISASAAISRSKIAAGSANHVIINNATGYLSSEAQLAVLRGGTGQDFSASTGFIKVTSGTMSALALIPYSSLTLTASIVNGDVASAAALDRTKIATGTANHVIINTAGGVLSSEATLATSRGGLGTNAGSSSGVPLFTTGSVSFLTFTQTTYTPALSFGSATTGITQTTSYGQYTRLGSFTHCEVYIVLSSKGSATGQARVTLPVAATSPLTGASATLTIENIDIPANYYTLTITTEAGVASGLLVFSGDNVGTSIATDTAFSATSTLKFSLSYSN